MSGPPRGVRNRAAGLGCMVVLALGCADVVAPTSESMPPGLTIPKTPVAAVPLSRRPGSDLAGRVAAVEDASERLAASLGESSYARELRGKLRELARACVRADRCGSQRAVDEVRTVLASFWSSPESNGLAPELSAIELALDAIE